METLIVILQMVLVFGLMLSGCGLAKITPSALVDKVSGKLGGLVFGNWKGTGYARMQAKTIHNPSTVNQAKARNALAIAAQAWRNLPPEFKILWKESAQALTSSVAHQNQIGDTQLIGKRGHAMSGFNLFSSTNLNLIQNGLPTVTVPAERALPGIEEINVDMLGGAAIVELVSFTGVEPGDILRLFVKTNWSGGHTYIIRQRVVDVGDIGPDNKARFSWTIFDVRAGHEADIADLPLVAFLGKSLLFQADIIGPDGARSTASGVVNKEINALPGSPIADNMLSVWHDVSQGYKADMIDYVAISSAPFHLTGVYVDQKELAAFGFKLARFFEEEPSVNPSNVTKSGLETAGCPLTVAEDLAAEVLWPVRPGESATGLTAEW